MTLRKRRCLLRTDRQIRSSNPLGAGCLAALGVDRAVAHEAILACICGDQRWIFSSFDDRQSYYAERGLALGVSESRHTERRICLEILVEWGDVDRMLINGNRGPGRGQPSAGFKERTVE